MSRALHPQLVLRVVRLGFDRHPPPAECLSGNGLHEGSHKREAVERVEAAVVRTVAVGPLVVADRVDERILKRGIEIRGDLEPGIEELGTAVGTSPRKQHEPTTVSDWLVDSRGGTRTHDPGIMSAVL